MILNVRSNQKVVSQIECHDTETVQPMAEGRGNKRQVNMQILTIGFDYLYSL